MGIIKPQYLENLDRAERLFDLGCRSSVIIINGEPHQVTAHIAEEEEKVIYVIDEKGNDIALMPEDFIEGEYRFFALQEIKDGQIQLLS